MIALSLFACLEYSVYEPPVVPPAEPPGLPEQGVGGPPDWNNCQEGWLGRYTNLPADHPDMEPPATEVPPDDPTTVDWWDDTDFQRYDPTLDFGANWWPVDDGLEGDPGYYAVEWVAWLRAWDDTTVDFLLGSSDDSFVLLDGAVIAARPGVQPFSTDSVSLSVDSGQYPITVRYAHRSGESGFRFRVISGDVSLCYPDFGE